jgi:hypothetical protein
MPPGDAPFDGSFEQFEGYLRLGAETGIFFATFKVVRGGVGLDLQRVVESLISPKRAHGDHSIVYLTDARKVLAAHAWAVFLPSLRSPVSSMTRAPLSFAAVAGSSSRSSTLRRFICS